MTPIANMNVYNDGMRKSMLDKIWFLDKIDGGIDTIYDYGCADGSLLKIVGEICPSMKLIGYDISQEMIDIAKQNVPNADYLSTNPKSDLHNTMGIPIYIPFGDDEKADLIAEFDGKLNKIQVKTSIKSKNGCSIFDLTSSTAHRTNGERR